ncbi:MAG TPA: hypothetical protein ENK25_08405 [Bacteroidetes bacterium]|nr:hypothetical protein [Bacteroidota bacterium]
MKARSLLREESNRHAVMLKDLLKNAGLLVILLGVIILSIVVLTGTQTNTQLSLSLGLIVLGLLAHIVINKMVD